jgi:hypothetical protein
MRAARQSWQSCANDSAVGAAMPRTPLPSWLSRLGADLLLFAATGLVMAILGPFGSAELPFRERLPYWLACMVGGGAVGIGIDELVRRRVRHFWARLLATSVLMTPGVSAVVVLVNATAYGAPPAAFASARLWFQVFVVSFAAMCLRQLAWAHPVAPVATTPSTAEPATDPTAAFRRRLSARRRGAAILAVEAEDHYLRVHTDAGDELISGRFGDALAELAGAPGFRTHRSWWVAAEAIDDVRWMRGRGEARLKCGLTAPISRGQAAPLKAAGWF